MSIKTLALAKAKSLGITNIILETDTDYIVASATGGYMLELTPPTPKGKKKSPPVQMPCVRAKSWHEMFELLRNCKHVKNGGTT